jgi:hypothetical protein
MEEKQETKTSDAVANVEPYTCLPVHSTACLYKYWQKECNCSDLYVRGGGNPTSTIYIKFFEVSFKLTLVLNVAPHLWKHLRK